MELRNFSIKNFNESKNDKRWNFGNDVLYKLCRKHPLHTKDEEIRAKIWLIGRSYAAPIERRRNKKKINDDFYDYVVGKFIEFNSKKEFDKKLSRLRNKEFGEKTLNDILTIHKELTDFFHELTNLRKRSLASKYLHFHVPIFPIYDSRSCTSIRKIDVKIEKSKLIGDKEYSDFCHRILYLYVEIKKRTTNSPTLREIDNFLIHIANDRLKKESKD